MTYLIIFIGGGAGAVSRFILSAAVNKFALQCPRFAAFPLGTLFVNLAGSLLIGVLSALFAFSAKQALTEHLRLLTIVGFLGGFTTFSSYSLETARLFLNGGAISALANLLISNTLGIFAALLGLFCVKFFFTNPTL